MASMFKKFAFMAIGALVGGCVEGGLTIADDRHMRKKLGLPKDATDEEVRDMLRDLNQKIDIDEKEAEALNSAK